MKAVYGAILELPIKEASLSLFGLFIFLTIIEGLLKMVEKYALRRHYELIFDKLKEELMLLGILSFTIFIVETANPLFFKNHYEWYHAFEVMHILILFVAFAFVVQALFLVHYMKQMSNNYIRYLRVSPADLQEEYIQMLENAQLSTEEYAVFTPLWFFDNTPFWMPSFSPFKDSLEFKICERLFLQQHPVPEAFEYATYVRHLSLEYVAECGRITPISWFIMSIIVLINYVKVVVLDAGELTRHCSRSGKEEPYCVEYLMRYSFIASIFLNVYGLIVYLFACNYYKSAIILGLERTLGNFKYEDKERSALYTKYLSLLSDFHNDIHVRTQGLRVIHESVMNFQSDIRERQYEKKHRMLMMKQHPDWKWRYVAIIRNYLSKLVHFIGVPKGDGRNEQMFLFESPRIFFQAVEFNIVAQNFYVSVVLTQLIPVAIKSAYAAQWIIALLLPIAMNFIFIRSILPKAVILHSLWRLDNEILGKVCEESIEETVILSKVKAAMRKNVPIVEKTPLLVYEYMRKVFDSLDVNNSNGLDKAEFRVFLDNNSVYLTRQKFEMCWRVIDSDLSGSITFDEIFAFVYPDLKGLLKQKLSVADIVRKKFIEILIEKAPSERWTEELFKFFDYFDADKSGFIDDTEFFNMITEVGLSGKVSQKDFKALVSSLNLSDDGRISWIEFESLILNPHTDQSPAGFDDGGTSYEEVPVLIDHSKPEISKKFIKVTKASKDTKHTTGKSRKNSLSGDVKGTGVDAGNSLAIDVGVGPSTVERVKAKHTSIDTIHGKKGTKGVYGSVHSILKGKISGNSTNENKIQSQRTNEQQQEEGSVDADLSSEAEEIGTRRHLKNNSDTYSDSEDDADTVYSDYDCDDHA